MRATPSLQLLDLGGDDHATAAAEDFDVPTPALAQQIDRVLEEFDVPALIRADGDAVRILLHGRRNDLVHGAVVSEMNDFHPACLEHAADDVDRSVMAVEQRSRCDEAHRGVSLGRAGRRRGGGQVGHGMVSLG